MRRDVFLFFSLSNHTKDIGFTDYDLYSFILGDNVFPQPDLDGIAMSLTMRHCLAALRTMRRGTPFKEAIKLCIVNTIGIKDIKIAAEIYESVVETMVVK